MDSTAGRLLGKAPPGVVSRLVVELKIINEAQTDSRLECAFIVKEPGSFLGCGFFFFLCGCSPKNRTCDNTELNVAATHVSNFCLSVVICDLHLSPDQVG